MERKNSREISALVYKNRISALRSGRLKRFHSKIWLLEGFSVDPDQSWMAAPSDTHNLQGLQANLYGVFISGVTNMARIFTAVGAFVASEAILHRRIVKAVAERKTREQVPWTRYFGLVAAVVKISPTFWAPAGPIMREVHKGSAMLDFLMIAYGVGFFVIAILYSLACEKM